ncbi:MAG: iron-containing alcohol dehydrogenase, partial [Planctomycetota bacterium]|nr:iron-containing alcohol dehydrogenase [Planctomycetota bacterium]
AVLDPLTTLTQPAHVTAATGIDAISHAVESYVTRERNPLSMDYSREAWRLLSENFPRVFSDPGDVEARAGMQKGASLAGLAIEASMLGAAHSAANPLTAQYGIVHGVAIGLVLPSVVRFNSSKVGAEYDKLTRTEGSRGEGLASSLEEFRELSGLPQALSAFKVRLEDIEKLSSDAESQWTARFNPVKVTAGDFQAIYRNAL